MQFILQNYNFLSQILAYKNALWQVHCNHSRAEKQRMFCISIMHFHTYHIVARCSVEGRSQRSRGLRCGYAAARLPGLRVRIPHWALASVSCECCVLSGRGLRRADPSSRGVLPTVVSLSAISKTKK
jgi:hypothetical protein